MRVTVRRVVLVAAVTILSACTLERRTDRAARTETSAGRQVIHPEGTASVPGVSPGVRSGGFLFLSGQIGRLADVEPPRLVDGGIEAETRQAMENVVQLLAAAGAGPADVLECTVFLADMDDYAAMDGVYADVFPGDPPARTVVGTGGLPLGARVQIACTAAVPQGG